MQLQNKIFLKFVPMYIELRVHEFDNDSAPLAAFHAASVIALLVA